MMTTGMGALIGLAIGILLILRKYDPAYSLIFSALIGGLIGGLDLEKTVTLMIGGVESMVPAILRILTAGVLAGILVKTSAATKIAESIVWFFGHKHVLAALVLATFFLTFVGVFIDVAVITVAPIALTVGAKMNLSRLSVLLAMIGGGKAGNIISPNPNTIAAASNFDVPLSSVMFVNIVPALIGLVVAILLARYLSQKGEILGKVTTVEPQVTASADYKTLATVETRETLPPLWASLAGPVIAIALIALRPIAGVNIDPLIALPAGGLAGLLLMNKFSQIKTCLTYGLGKMSGVAILLVGTGTIAGIIKNSDLNQMVLSFLQKANLSEIFIAPVSGGVLSAATASTTAGATVASTTFSAAIFAAGLNAVYAAATVNAGATTFDHLPHGSFFHATAGATETSLADRLRLIPYESAVGIALAAASTFNAWLHC